jgi:hypothetical protein
MMASTFTALQKRGGTGVWACRTRLTTSSTYADRREAYFPPFQRLHTGDGRCTDYFSYNELRIILAAFCNK